jgi:ADP-ribose pyrophosphatase YjhB (NUDIX family)
MVKHAVVGVVVYNGKILLGKKRKDSTKFLAGEWHVPGETVEDNETDEQALIRGIKEEAGIEIKVGRYLGTHTTPTSQREARWYECSALSDNVKASSDLEDIRWVDRREVMNICSQRATSLWSKDIQMYFFN